MTTQDETRPPLPTGTQIASPPSQVQNCVAQTGIYGISGDGSVGMGTPSLNEMAPGSTFDHNVLAQDGAIPFPPGNTIVSTTILATQLTSQFAYTGSAVSSDGKPMGCDIPTLLARIPWLVLP